MLMAIQSSAMHRCSSGSSLPYPLTLSGQLGTHHRLCSHRHTVTVRSTVSPLPSTTCEVPDVPQFKIGVNCLVEETAHALAYTLRDRGVAELRAASSANCYLAVRTLAAAQSKAGKLGFTISCSANYGELYFEAQFGKRKMRPVVLSVRQGDLDLEERLRHVTAMRAERKLSSNRTRGFKELKAGIMGELERDGFSVVEMRGEQAVFRVIKCVLSLQEDMSSAQGPVSSAQEPGSSAQGPGSSAQGPGLRLWAVEGDVIDTVAEKRGDTDPTAPGLLVVVHANDRDLPGS